ncbi:MAG: nucleotide exchange factor GrpE [Terriglobia bacterium]
MMDEEREEMMTTEPGEAGESETASAAEGAAAPAPQPAPAEALEKALAEKKELFDRLLRKQAEIENFRKRTQKEKEDLRQYAAEDLIRSLLPTLDGFERALQHRDETVPAAFYEGLELIYRQLREVLGRAGLSPIDTAGQLFDPHLHQAVETVDAPGCREHEIVEELQRGYRIRNKLLRPSIVKVAVGGSPAQDRADQS